MRRPLHAKDWESMADEGQRISMRMSFVIDNMKPPSAPT